VDFSSWSHLDFTSRNSDTCHPTEVKYGRVVEAGARETVSASDRANTPFALFASTLYMCPVSCPRPPPSILLRVTFLLVIHPLLARRMAATLDGKEEATAIDVDAEV
jgi:hypothetical protein